MFLRIQNVGRNKLLLDDTAFVRAPDTAEARRTQVQSGDVLLSITADLGRTAVIPKGIGRAFINQHLAILRLNDVDPHFVSAFLASPAGQVQIGGMNRQGVKAGLNFDNIRSILRPPPAVGGAAADCGDLGSSRGVAGQAPPRPRPTRHPHPIPLPRPLRRSGDEPQKLEHAFLSDLWAMPMRNGCLPSDSGGGKGEVLTLSAITGDANLTLLGKKHHSESDPPIGQSSQMTADHLICRGNGNIRLVA